MKILHVTNLKKVDTTRYIEGDLFLTDKQIGILHRGVIEPLVKKSDLNGYVKKADVQKMIDAAIKKEGSDVL